MELLPNGYQLDIPQGCFPLSTDSMVLSYFARSASGKILDLGSGCGTLGLLLCASNSKCTVTGIEQDAAAHKGALENISRNSLTQRMVSICDDLRRVPLLFESGSFSCCISNPPYFSGGPAAELTAARREDCCSLSDLMQSAAWALKYGGDFCLVHRPERLGEIIALAARSQMEAKRLVLLHHQHGSKINLILLQLRKGAKPGLTIEDWFLRHADGTPTSLYHEIYHC